MADTTDTDLDIAAARARVEDAERVAAQERRNLRAVSAQAKSQQQLEFDLKKTQAEKQIQDARGERAQVRSEIAAAYAAQAETERHAKIIGEEIWEAQQKRVVEDLMLKKLRLEKLQAKRSRLQDQLQETEGHLGSLDSELSRRDVQSNALLQDALQHTDALREALQAAEKDGSNLQQMWLQQCGSGSSEVAASAGEHSTREFNIVDELIAHRQQKLRKELRVKADSLRALNTERRELSKKRHDTARRRRELAQLMAKGKEFLAEIELGAAPPTEFIQRNLVFAERFGDGRAAPEIAPSDASPATVGSESGAASDSAPKTDADEQAEGDQPQDAVDDPQDGDQDEDEGEEEENLDDMVQRLQSGAVKASVELQTLRRASARVDSESTGAFPYNP